MRIRARVPVAIAVVVALAAGLSSSFAVSASAQSVDEAVGSARIEVVEQRAADRKVYLETDGSYTAEIHPFPIHYQATDGTWLPIDTTLVPSSGGWRNAAGTFSAQFAGDASAETLVSVTKAGRNISFGLAGAAPSFPVVDGSKITYPAVFPGVDLVYEVRNTGIKELVVLTRRPELAAGQDFTARFPILLAGVTPAANGGGFSFLSAQGQSIFQIPHLWMEDSSVGQISLDPAFSEAVTLHLQDAQAGQELKMSASREWLLDPARVYPVKIDPDVNVETNLDTFIQSNISNTPQSGSSELKSGTFDGGGTKARSLLKFNVSSLQGYTINSAQLALFENHSFSCSPTYVNVYRIIDWWGQDVLWSNQPGIGLQLDSRAYAKGYSASCPSGRIYLSVKTAVDNWLSNTWENNGLEVRANNETNNDGWKKFASLEATHHPWLEINYTVPDTTPPPAPSTSSSTHPSTSDWYANDDPCFSFSASDASGIEGYSYHVDQTSSVKPDNIRDTTGSSACLTNAATSDGDWYFHVRAKDNAGNWGTDWTDRRFRVDMTAPPTPSISSSTHSADTCSTNNDPSFSFSASDLSGIAGYSYVLDQSASTTPDDFSEGTATTKGYTDVADGDWWFHVRAQNGAGLWSPSTGHYKIKIDAVLPAAPSVSSSSHPNTSDWYASRNPSLGWSLSDVFGINGYSYALDQASSTTPDTTSEGTGTSTSYSALADGEHYFHVRGKDGCERWGDPAHFRVRVDGTAPGAPAVSSSSHPSESAWYSSNSPSFSFSASDLSGIDGYSHVRDQVSGTTPDQISEGTATSASFTGLSDGSHFFHVRARNGATLWGDAAQRQVNIDATNPSVPIVSSSTHPDETVTYASNDPTLSWSATDNLSGVAGYSYVLDQTSTTTPDTTSEGTSASKSYSDLGDGVWWFHVQAKDAAGNWGVPDHFKISINIPAPYVAPGLTGPSGRIDPDGNPVVKNGDLLTFSGAITEGVGGPTDLTATITKCDLVVKNDAGTEVNRLAVALTTCKNTSGNLSGSASPASLGTTRGSVHLEVIAERTQGGVTKSSGTRLSNALLVDNDAPMLADAPIGCLDDVFLLCDDSRTVIVELSEDVKGDFLAVDFTVTSNTVLAVNSACSTGAYCDEVTLTLDLPVDTANPPTVSYGFVSLAGRAAPHDGAGHTLSSGTVAARDINGTTDIDVDADFFADDPLEPATSLSATPQGLVLSLDDNIFQAIADDGTAICPEKFAGDATNKEKKCDEAGRERRLAQRIVALATKPLGTDDGMSYAPDILLFQETRSQDARRIAGHLNRLIVLDGTTCNTQAASDRCYKVAAASSQRVIAQTTKREVVSDTAIVYNRRTMRLNTVDSFMTSYTKGEKCVPTRDATGSLIFIDEDLDGLNDCGTKRKIKKHFMASITEKGTVELETAVTSIHFVTSSHLKNEDVHDLVKERWAQKAANELTTFRSTAQLYALAGDFNIRRCFSPVKPEPVDPLTCGERPWWKALTDLDDQFDDAVYVRNVLPLEMEKQYKNGTRDAALGKRIDFIFTRNATRTDPSGASRNFTCGLSDTSRPTDQQTCHYLANIERYSDHLLQWALAGR